MLNAILILLGCQLAGEATARSLGLPLPGPVLGLVLLLAGFALFPALPALMRPLASGLLAHLSLLFVPAGVGVIGHLDRLGGQGAVLLAALVVSTGLAIAAGALAFVAVSRLTEGPGSPGAPDDDPASGPASGAAS
ncbi:CidA/LrgA family protein [Szabonella alba]|uniref:CidA/LrgA family protein n=1 Tax=Szabonella alba TaxID=2804194 RepID=A0A8K0VEX2_9RHOB|nr:CidA/LrgA family protein [Szabonella alba]MBL4918042.1 CidA/LrgA family protein [Szabonella alba]